MTPDQPRTDGKATARSASLLPSLLVTVVETSVIVRTLQRWGRGSTLYAVLRPGWRRTAQTIARWSDASLIYTGVRQWFRALDEVCLRWIRNARLYRWLTADPEPNVITVDLRDSRVLAPLLSLLERTLAVLVPAVINARTRRLAGALRRWFVAAPLHRLGVGTVSLSGVGLAAAALTGTLTRIVAALLLGGAAVGVVLRTDRRSWRDLRTTTLGRLLVAIFVPPEPPAQRDDRQATDGASDDAAPTANGAAESPDAER